VRVIVIGAGLQGLTSAWYLHRAGVEVTVLDRAGEVADGASHANGGLLTPSLADPWNSPGAFGALLRSLRDPDAALRIAPGALRDMIGWGLRFLRSSHRQAFQQSFLDNVRLAVHSRQLLHELLQRQPMDFDHAANGILKLFPDAQALDHGVAVANWLKQCGVEHRLLDAAALAAAEPSLAGEHAGALAFPQDEVGDARRFCQGLAQALRQDGVEFLLANELLKVRRRGRRVEQLATPRGPLEAEAYVLAAGALSWPLGRLFGLRLPVRPARGCSLTLTDVPPGEGPRHALVDEGRRVAVVPLGAERVRVAGTAEFVGFDAPVDAGRVALLEGQLETLFPALAERPRLEPWTGLRPVTPDGRPLIGRSRLDNLWLNTGHGALGWTHACASGELLADLLTDQPPALDPAPYAPGRF